MKTRMTFAGLCLLAAGLAGLSARALAAADQGLIFYVPFESNATAIKAGGDPAPLKTTKPGVPAAGILGQGMKFGKGQVLNYATTNNYNDERGSLSFWFKFESAPERTNTSASYFFNEGGSYVPRFQFCGKYAAYLAQEQPSTEYWDLFTARDVVGEWHQLMVTWVTGSVDQVYLDGQAQSMRRGRPRAPRGDKRSPAIMFANVQTDFSMVMDEIMVYDRPLTAAEAAAEYSALFPLAMKASSIIYREGAPGTVNLRLTNPGQQPVKGALSYTISRNSKEVVRGQRENLVVAPGQTAEETMPFTPAEAGEYLLALTFKAKTEMTSGQKLYALAKGKLVKAEEHPELKLKLIKEFDCTREYGPEEYCDDGMCKVVQGPAGKYRETGSEKSCSRFAYRFAVPDPDCPYLAALEYPDDKERIMEVMVDEKPRPENCRAYGDLTHCPAQTMENGLIVGGEFPNSGQMKEVRYLFYPRWDKECVIQVMAWPRLSAGSSIAAANVPLSAACRSIKIYKVLNAYLPPVKLSNLPPKAQQRVIGYEEENGTIDISLFRVPMDKENLRYEDMFKILDRWTEYSQFVGLNLITFPLIHYMGAHYPSKVYAKSGGGYANPDYWVDQALDLCAQKDIKFYASICYWDDPELQKIVFDGPDKEGVARGEDTILQVAWNGDMLRQALGHDVKYDILNPVVEKRILAIVQDLLDTYGGHSAFGGLAFWYMPLNSLWFGNLNWGYSDRDVGLFEKETGIKVEIKNEKLKIKNEATAQAGMSPEALAQGDPKRFLKRYLFLVKGDPAIKEKWIAWRCQKVKDLWLKISALVRAKNPGFKIAIYPDHGYLDTAHPLDFWRPGDLQSVARHYRGGGLDLEQFKQIPNLLIGKTARPNVTTRGDEQWWKIDYNEFAVENIEPLKSPNGNAVWIFQDRWEFDNLPAQPLTNYWWKGKEGKEIVPSHKSGGVVPHGDYFLESYANTLADFDAWYISDGGITVTQLGHEDDLREFVCAYRTLPAEHFAVFKNTDDPLCVRFREREDGLYCYAVNRMYFPLKIKLAFNAAGSFKLLDLPADKEIKVKGALDLELAPFRVRAFRAPKGVLLKEVQVEAPAVEIGKLKERLDAYHGVLNQLKAQNIQLDKRTRGEEAWLTAEAERAWAEKRYARVWHLLDGYHAKKLKRVLTDPQLRSYLTVPDEYREKYFAPARATVRKVASIPALDASEWKDYTITDVFAEVMQIEGHYVPRPAKDRTVVAACYDGEALGFLFRCYDRELEKVQAKEVQRDGNVFAKDDDAVEIFLSHAEGNKPYYHFMANFGRSRHDKVKYDIFRPTPAKYNPEWSIETKKEPDAWISRIVIPFQGLEQTPVSGAVWGLNLCRDRRGLNIAYRCDDRGFGGGGFHCPEYFAELKFE